MQIDFRVDVFAMFKIRIKLAHYDVRFFCAPVRRPHQTQFKEPNRVFPNRNTNEPTVSYIGLAA